MPTEIEYPEITVQIASLAGKYLTFVLGDESYGIPVLRVREIIRVLDITPIPRMPSYVRGVTNLHGKIVPVIDLRLRFEMTRSESTEKTCIIVVRIALASGEQILMGLAVDAVEEIANMTAGDIEEPPRFGASVGTEFILGMARIKGAVKTLLDIDEVVTGRMAAQIAEVARGHRKAASQERADS